MAKGKSGKRVPPPLRMDAGEITNILEGHYHPKRHSDGRVPWQFALADYCVRFSKKGRDDSGTWGIYLRAYNVCLATFADNSAFLRDALARMFDAAHAQSESWKEAGRKVKGQSRPKRKRKIP